MCPRGQVRLKQGRQGKSSTKRLCAFLLKGGVNLSEVEPYITVTGTSTAQAICINPESLLTTCSQAESKYTASSRLVFPAKS